LLKIQTPQTKIYIEDGDLVKGGVKLTLINNQGDYVILRNAHRD